MSRRATGWAAAVCLPAGLTAGLLPFRSDIDLSSVLLLFLLTVLAAASVGGPNPTKCR